MACNWFSRAKSIWNANGIIPGTDRHIKNVVFQQNTLLDEESFIADIGNGKAVIVTIKDCIRKSGREKWDITGVCSDGRSTNLVVKKSDQPNKMRVAEAVIQKLI